MAKRKSQVVDLENLKEKKKSQSTLSIYFGGSTPSAKSKVEKEKVSAKRPARTVSVETVRNSWFTEGLEEYDGEKWLEYDVDGKLAKNLRCKVSVIIR